MIPDSWFNDAVGNVPYAAGNWAIVILDGTVPFHKRSNPGRSLTPASISSGLWQRENLGWILSSGTIMVCPVWVFAKMDAENIHSKCHTQNVI